MNKKILKSETQDFIQSNIDADVVSFLFKKPFFPGVSNKELVQQIISKKKAKTKLPTWHNTPNIYYPEKLHLEQSSSEIAAAYKSGLVDGQSLLDVTGGLGVDSYFFASRISQVAYSEKNHLLSEIASHNFEVFGIKNITVRPGDAIDFLKESKYKFDWIYLDPSRRHGQKGKVYKLNDCTPDVTNILELLLQHSDSLMIKTSPILDISMGLDQLRFVKEIHIVAIKNEVKELIWIIKAGHLGEQKIKTVNFQGQSKDTFSFSLSEEKITEVVFSEPLNFLYEPNAAILKSGAFSLVAHRYSIKKLQEHSHLYTSEKLIDFPGRRFKIEKVIPYAKGTLKKMSLRTANLTVRNFPENVASLRKQFKIQEGGDSYIFFTMNIFRKKIVIFCSKV